MFQALSTLGGLALVAALVLPNSTSVTAPNTAADAYRVDPVHSSAVFSAIHFGASRFYGRFNDVSGSIEFDAAKPEVAKVSIEIDVASVDTHDKKRDQHLSGPDFFSAKEFPTMSFESESVKVLRPASATEKLLLEVTGKLEILGKSRPMVVEVEQVGAGDGMGGTKLVGFETHFGFNRSDFGMDFMLGGISDEIGVILSVEAGK